MGATSNIRIIPRSVLDGGVLLENDDTDDLYPLSQLQFPQVSNKWRTKSAIEQQIISDLVHYESVSGWSLNGHNLGFGSTVRLSLYTSVNRSIDISGVTFASGVATITFSQLHGLYDDGSSVAVRFADIVGSVELNDKVWDCRVVSSNALEIDIAAITPYISGGTGISLREVFDRTQDGQPVQYGWGEQPWGLGGWYGFGEEVDTHDFVTFWFDAVAVDYMRVIINDTSNVDGYIEAGRMFLGLSVNPEYNFLFGAGIAYRSQTTVQRTRSGSLLSDNRPSYRVAEFQLSFLTEDEAMMLLDMMDTPGLRSDALISMYPDHQGRLGQKTTMLGRFVEISPLTREPSGYSLSITFEEAL